jgi:phage FluMu protein Com
MIKQCDWCGKVIFQAELEKEIVPHYVACNKCKNIIQVFYKQTDEEIEEGLK